MGIRNGEVIYTDDGLGRGLTVIVEGPPSDCHPRRRLIAKTQCPNSWRKTLLSTYRHRHRTLTAHLARNKVVLDLRYASYQVLQAAASGRDSGSRG
jgi:hypothetical protein